ncbi:MAG: LptF/LptG family permease [Gemmataceae bacterium]
MFGTLIQRSVFGQLLRVFLLALVALTGLFVMAGLFAEAAQRGLAPSQIFAVIPLLIPNTLPYTLPATTLFATCVVYGRLAADNEVLAVKSAGARLGGLLRPGLWLGLGAAGVTMWMYFTYIPQTHRILRTQVIGDVEELLLTILKRHGCLRHPKTPFSMWVREVQGKRLIDVVFKQRDEKGGYDVVARAREAEIHYDASQKLIKIEMPNCVVIGENGGSGIIGERTWEVPLPQDMLSADYPNRPSDLTWPELWERRAVVVEEMGRLQRELDHPELNDPPEDGLPPDRQEDLATYRRHAIKSHVRDVHCIDAELHQRPALAVGCLCFVLVGGPIGIWFGRSDYLSAFITCFLPTVFIYYPLLLAGTNMARDGAVPAYVGIWAADVITAGAAITLRMVLLRR